MKEAMIRQIQQKGRAAALVLLLTSAGAGIAGCNEPTLPAYDGTTAITPTTVITPSGETPTSETNGPTSVSSGNTIPAGMHLNQGDCITANPGDEVIGDPNINGQELHDALAETGQITVFDQSATVCMEVGAGTLRRGVMELPNAIAILQMDKNAMETPGSGNCTGSCSSVSIEHFPSGQTIHT